MAEGRTLCIGFGESVGLVLETEVGALVGALAALLLDGNGVGGAVGDGVVDAVAEGEGAGETFAPGVIVGAAEGMGPIASLCVIAEPPVLEHPDSKVATHKSTAACLTMSIISYRALSGMEEGRPCERVPVNIKALSGFSDFMMMDTFPRIGSKVTVHQFNSVRCGRAFDCALEESLKLRRKAFSRTSVTASME